MKKFLVLCLAVLLVSCGAKEKEMAIDFGGVDGQYIDFGSPSAVDNLTQKTVSWWAYLDGYGESGYGTHFSKSLNNGWEIWNQSDGVLVYYHSFSGVNGRWHSAASSYSLSNFVHFALSYDSSSTLNDPLLYVNGAAVSMTEIASPAGSSIDDSAQNLYIGNGVQSTNYAIDGKVSGVRIYNRILTADEVATIYSARGADNIKNGLVFCPVLYGAKGLQVFDGSTLSTANLIIDPCSGASGVPTGSPVAVGETYLSIKPK